jgi:hypothetical protein
MKKVYFISLIIVFLFVPFTYAGMGSGMGGGQGSQQHMESGMMGGKQGDMG